MMIRTRVQQLYSGSIDTYSLIMWIEIHFYSGYISTMAFKKPTCGVVV